MLTKSKFKPQTRGTDKTMKVSVAMSPDMYDRIGQAIGRQDLTRAGWIRRAIEESLERSERRTSKCR